MGLTPSGARRWLKFEEDVEDGGERWSKPYVATLSLHSLFELRNCIIKGTVLLDMCANSTEEIAGTAWCWGRILCCKPYLQHILSSRNPIAFLCFKDLLGFALAWQQAERFLATLLRAICGAGETT